MHDRRPDALCDLTGVLLWACVRGAACCLAGIDREASKQHGFLASVEKLVNDPTKRTTVQNSGISKYVAAAAASACCG